MTEWLRQVEIFGCILIVISCWGASAAVAQQHRETPTPEQKKAEYANYTLNRYKRSKLVTPNPYPVKPGQFQLQLAYAYAATDYTGANDFALSRRPFLAQNTALLSAETGLARWFSIGLSTGYGYRIDHELAVPTSQGALDVSIFSKYLFTQNIDLSGQAFAIGHYALLSFPSGTQTGITGLQSRAKYFTLLNGISITNDFTNRFTSNYAFGYNWFFGPKAERASGVAFVQSGFGYMATHWLQPVAEVIYQREIANGPDSERVSLVGGVLVSGKTTRIRLGVEQSIAARNADLITTIIAGVTVTF